MSQKDITSEGRTLLLHAVRSLRSRDPEEVLPFVEESLTVGDARAIDGFLRWSLDNDQPFGHANIDEVIERWLLGSRQKLTS